MTVSILPLPYGLDAAGHGSALADLFSGYIVYAPATFIIKALMAVVAYSFYKLFAKKAKATVSRLFSGILSEFVMILGYFFFEGILYGFVILITVFEKQNIIKLLK